ncbi:MAG TPA: ABC transporter permease [Conexibacter sp.]|nr:ABC transporter permease [Conexibacter sp.]
MVRLETLLHFYRKRLRVHAVQELLAGTAIAVSVALVLALQAANGGVGAAGQQNLRALSGDATLTLAARDERGFDARMRARVAALPGVAHAAVVLEQGASVAYGGRRVQIHLLGADAELSSLRALATRRIDLGRLQPGIVLPASVARRLALVGGGRHAGLPRVRLVVRGRAHSVPVSAVLDRAMIGPLSGALLGFAPLPYAQRLAQLPQRATRLLVVPAPGQQALARAGLDRLAAGRLTVMSRDDELRALALATDAIDSSTTLLIAIGALVALLLAFTATLPTLADRRRFVAALWMVGCPRRHVVQILGFQAVALGATASAVGVLAGLLLARGADQELTGYLGFVFPLGTEPALGWQVLAVTSVCGVLASCVAAALPLLDLRRGGARAPVAHSGGAGPTGGAARRRLAVGGLVAVGVVAVFAAIGMLGSQQSLLHGMYADIRGHLGTADVWIAQPGDDLALRSFDAHGLARRVEAVEGVRDVRALRSNLLDVGDRRVWLVARPDGDRPLVPGSQIVEGDEALLATRLRDGGWVAVSQQVADAQGTGVGRTIRLPTPAGSRTYRVAAITTNLAWGPGAVVMSARDHRRAWGTADPSALEVELAPGADPQAAVPRIRRALGATAGLEVETARVRIARATAVAHGGLAWSERAAQLLSAAAALAMAAAIGAGTWQRRAELGSLRQTGWRLRLWGAWLWETLLVLGTGCLVGVAAGVYGQYLVDAWLQRAIDDPAASPFAAARTVATWLLVFALAFVVTTVPGALRPRTSPRASNTPGA